MELKWSQFVFQTDSLKEKEKIILRNSFTSGTVKIERKVKQEIDELMQESVFEDSEINGYIEKLERMKMIVPLKMDERKNYLDIFHSTRNDSSIFVVYLVTTTNCQLKCSYCYEEGIDCSKKLELQMCDNIISWCKSYIEAHPHLEKLRIILYGGEPLLNKKAIRYILPQLYEIAKRKGMEFETQIVTNGVLLDLSTAFFLKEYKVGRIQITLDGPKNVHDKRRMRKNGKGTFELIFENILRILEVQIIDRVSLRINFDRDNVNYIPELLNLLSEKNLQPRLELSFGIITSTVNKVEQAEKMNTHIKKHTLNEEENVEKYLWLCKEAKERGFAIGDEFMTGPWCTARDIHSVVIESDGSMNKCFSGVGRKEFIFGNIVSSKECYDYRLSNFSYLEECFAKKCPYVPICGGGCRFEAFVHLKDIQQHYCQFKLMEGINKGLIQLNY